MEVRRTWSEQELVRSFGGRQSPGTPDGMLRGFMCMRTGCLDIDRGRDLGIGIGIDL